jgi:hypothetical protein
LKAFKEGERTTSRFIFARSDRKAAGCSVVEEGGCGFEGMEEIAYVGG